MLMLYINMHPLRGRLLEKKRLMESAYYNFNSGKMENFIKEGRSKERGSLLEKIWCITVR